MILQTGAQINNYSMNYIEADAQIKCVNSVLTHRYIFGITGILSPTSEQCHGPVGEEILGDAYLELPQNNCLIS